MVQFINLAGDDTGPDHVADLARLSLGHNPSPARLSGPIVGPPQFYSRVTEAIGSYPIIIEIAARIDLNTLHSLALTCRQVRRALLQYRRALLLYTLRCCNEPVPVNHDEVFRLRARARNYWVPRRMLDGGVDVGNGTGDGKPSLCARDLVAPCRRCGQVVCRNCAMKPPAGVSLRERHRRLCHGCSSDPLATLVTPPLDPKTTLSSDALRQAMCRCESTDVYLCQPCGRSIRAMDHEYYRIWRWRIHYGELLGGLGTGIGDCDRGVVCGREQSCCLGRDHEVEVDSDAQDARDAAVASSSADAAAAVGDSGTGAVNMISGTGIASGSSSDGAAAGMQGSPHGSSPGTQATDPGYERHEIQGIGGVLKKKLLRIVRVGAGVPEWADEMAKSDQVLGRETRGAVRSWCGWCNRVIPAKEEWEGVEA